MDNKTYKVKLKALKTNPEINCQLNAMRGKKKVSVLNKKMETDLESIFLTDAKHNVAGILTGGYDYYEEKFDVRFRSAPELTNLGYAFDGCMSVTNIDVSGIDTSNVTNLEAAFQFCQSLKHIDLSNWDTSKVTNFHWMFFYCKKLERVDGVIDMAAMPRSINNNTIDSFELMFDSDAKNLRDVKLKNVPDNFMNNVTIRRGSLTTQPGYKWCGFNSPDQFEIVS